MRTVVVVLAAGGSTRFGSAKLLAQLDGRPLLQSTLDAVAAAGMDEVVVVLGEVADRIERAIDWRSERRVVNPAPADGLSSSLRIGLAAAGEDPGVEAALVVLGDQPWVRPAVLAAVAEAGGHPQGAAPIVRARYAGDGAPNPVLIRRDAWPLAAALEADRGLGPLLASRPDLVLEVPVDGANPDVDTPADLARGALAATPARSEVPADGR
jgi:molybdenum cofactor cytidylyltransferase